MQAPVGGSPLMFELPECFYTSGNPLTGIALTNVIIIGSADEPDPLVRVFKALATSSVSPAMNIQNFIPLDAALNPASSINWEAMNTASPPGISLRYGRYADGVVLPSSLDFPYLSLSYCNIGGTIPTTFLANYDVPNNFQLELPGNRLEGTVPHDFLDNLDLSSLTYFYLDLSSNSLNGTFPAITNAMPLIRSFSLYVNHNQFSGDISSVLNSAQFGSLNMQSYIRLNDNFFTGSLPRWFAASQLQEYSLDVSNNRLTGSIPSDFFSSMTGLSNLALLDLFVQGNQLSGALPPDLLRLSDSNPNSISLSRIRLSFSDNNLSGSIPPTFFVPLNWTRTSIAVFDFSQNQFTGNLPSTIYSTAPSSSLSYHNFTFSQNSQLAGSVPSTFLASLGAPANQFFSGASIVYVNIDSTKLTGTLEMPDLSARDQPLLLYLNASNSNFNHLAVAGSTSGYLYSLDMSNNPNLVGQLPFAQMFPSAILSVLLADNTQLSGIMPDLGSTSNSLSSISFNSSFIDFCSSPRSVWAPTLNITLCRLDGTNALACRDKYPSNCTFRYSSTCDEATRPSPDFFCKDGTWIFYGNLNSSVITIPVGSTTPVVVSGNISASTIVLGGTNSSIIVQGCANNLDNITILLQLSELAKLSPKELRKLISVDPNANCSDLNAVQINIDINGSSCKKVKTKKVVQNGQLSALFMVDESGCKSNTWWIILVSVLVPVIVIAVLVIILLVVFVPSVRNFFRPYSKRTGAAGL